jgi:hypothetical protein
MLRTALAAMLVALTSAPMACAEPPTPQSAGACTAELAGVMTRLPGAAMPAVCQDGEWQTVTTPQPPADRWLSSGPALTLHGQGMRNPDMASGEWTATPQDSTGRCRAQHQEVLSPAVLSGPVTDEGEPGQPLTFHVPPRMATIELTGFCLWVRK